MTYNDATHLVFSFTKYILIDNKPLKVLELIMEQQIIHFKDHKCTVKYYL